ncbi:MAG: methyltransferase domain-containing protein [Actinobacteria bacterium]|nr:methyltransferase domain-containing protein [Actinomycetota bacterium]
MQASSTAAEAIPWYHTIDLGDGVVTPGFYDHRLVVERLPLPASLAGMRCLDVGSSDGFWAFEMARRGAAVVVSVDLEDPARQEWQGIGGAPRAEELVSSSGRWEGERHRTRRAFELARETLGLDVERHDLSVYDLDPERLGRFDFVFMGSLLLHLRDPVRALSAVRTVTAGDFLSFEPIAIWLSAIFPRVPAALLWDHDEPRWWTPNLAGLRRLVAAAGFDVLRAGGPLRQPFGHGMARRPPLRRPTMRELVFWTTVRPFGAPSAWVLARPASS